MWSCIWPPATSVVYCRRSEYLVPMLTTPEQLQQTNTTHMHTRTHTQTQNRNRHTHSLHSSPVLWQHVAVYQPFLFALLMCVHMHSYTQVCELHSQMPSHDSLSVNTQRPYYPQLSLSIFVPSHSGWLPGCKARASAKSPYRSPPKPGLTTLTSLHQRPQ